MTPLRTSSLIFLLDLPAAEEKILRMYRFSFKLLQVLNAHFNVCHMMSAPFIFRFVS